MKNAPFRHRVEYAGYWLVKGLLRAVPHPAARRFGRGLGALAHGVLRSRRRQTLENLRLALPELGEEERRRILKESFRQLGQAFCDPLSAARFDAVEFCRRLTLEGWEHLQAAESLGHGVFIMSAHLGCWEAAAQPIALYGGTMDVVGRPLDNPHLDRDLVALRTRFGNRILEKRGAARAMMKVLRAGGKVGILIDQRSSEADAVEVPFFGQPARTTTALARMSMRTGAPVVPIFGYPEARGRYRVVLRPAILPPTQEQKGQAADAAAQRLTARYMEVVEQEIRRQPPLWMWLHRRWRP